MKLPGSFITPGYPTRRILAVLVLYGVLIPPLLYLAATETVVLGGVAALIALFLWGIHKGDGGCAIFVVLFSAIGLAAGLFGAFVAWTERMPELALLCAAFAAHMALGILALGSLWPWLSERKVA